MRCHNVLRHALWPAPFSLRVSSPSVVFFCRRRFASNSADSSRTPEVKKPVLSPKEPPEQSQELDAITSRLGSSYILKPGSPWGYAVVRTVYGPGTEAPWRRILQLLSDSARDTCAFYSNAGDLSSRHVLTPIEDAARLDAASSHTVRSVFKQWASDEMQAWTAQPDVSPPIPDAFFGTRYNFCLFFDRVCLESLEREQPQPVVKLLAKDWQPAGPPCDQSSPPGHWEDGVTDEAEEDVGWMYIDLEGYVDTYGQLDDPDWWHELYIRAPDEHPIFAGPRKGDERA